MATINFQIKLKAAEEYMILHPETSADLVKFASDKITATNVKDALDELMKLIEDITGGGVVTGIKFTEEGETEMGDVLVDAEKIGLGSVAEDIETLKTDVASVKLTSGAELKITENGTGTYDYYIGLYNAEGDLLGTQYHIDLPIESLIMDVSYADKTLTITLENGTVLEVPIGDIVDGLVNTSDFEAAIQALSDRIDTINTAEGNVEEAVAKAQEAADKAQSAADTAETHVAEVKEAAENAQTDATQALEDAGKAQGTADTAKEAIDTLSEEIDDDTIVGVHSAVGVNKKGIVVEGQNILEVWWNGETGSDTLAEGGIAIAVIPDE